MLFEMELLHLEACKALPAAKITSCGSLGGTELLQGHSAGCPKHRRKLWPLAEGPRHCEALSHCCHWLAISLWNSHFLFQLTFSFLWNLGLTCPKASTLLREAPHPKSFLFPYTVEVFGEERHHWGWAKRKSCGSWKKVKKQLESVTQESNLRWITAKEL